MYQARMAFQFEKKDFKKEKKNVTQNKRRKYLHRGIFTRNTENKLIGSLKA